MRVTGWYDKSKVDILWSYINYQYRLIPKLLIEIQTKVWKCFVFFSPWDFKSFYFIHRFPLLKKKNILFCFNSLKNQKLKKELKRSFKLRGGPRTGFPCKFYPTNLKQNKKGRRKKTQQQQQQLEKYVWNRYKVAFHATHTCMYRYGGSRPRFFGVFLLSIVFFFSIHS